MKYLSIIITSLFILSIANIASADVKKIMNKMESGYGYTFDDDPLNAGGFSANDAIIKVRPKAARTTLIRPRTSFVYEMLKSVEQI